MLKKAASWILIVAVLVSSTGFTLHKHSCRKMAVTKTYLISSPIHCCKNKANAGCHSEGETARRNCCSFSADYKFLDTDKRVQPGFELQVPVFLTHDYPALFVSVFNCYEKNAGREIESPPPKSSLQMLTEFCILRV